MSLLRRRLRRLPLARTLLLSSLAFSLPIAVLLYFAVAGTVAKVRSARTELLASSVLRPLTDALELTARHARLGLVARGGDARARRELAAAADRLDGAVAAIAAAFRQHGAALRVDDATLGDRGLLELAPAELAARWRELRTQAGTLAPAELVARHERLQDDLLALVRRVGDTGELVLDPELDSYYVSDVLVRSLPLVVVQLGRVETAFELARGAGATPSAAQVGLAATLAENYALKEAAPGLLYAVRQDYRFHGLSPTLQQNLPPAVAQFQATMRPLRARAASATTQADARELAAVADLAGGARVEAHRLWHTGSAALDALLRIRLHALYRDAGLTVGLSLLALGLAIVLVVLLARDIVRPLGDVVAIAGHVAVGALDRAAADLAAMEARRDFRLGDAAAAHGNELERLARAVGAMAESLRALLTQMRRAGLQVAEDATTVAASTRQLEATVAENSAATHEAGATSRAIAAASQALLATVGEVARVAAVTGRTAGESRAGLVAMAADTDRLTAATDALTERLAAISEQAESIGSIVGTIGRVADRTHLLSINAGIEAEKAGPAGRGFAVVAGEMRRLGEQTAAATQEIAQLVEETRTAVSAGVATMNDFAGQVRHNAMDVRGIGARLGEVIAEVEALTPRLGDVQATMQTQADGATQIALALGPIDTAAQQTRQALEQLGRVATRLDGATRDLAREVAHFHLE